MQRVRATAKNRTRRARRQSAPAHYAPPDRRPAADCGILRDAPVWNAASIAWALAMVGLSAVTDVFAEIVPESGWIRALGPWSALVRVTEAAAGVTKPSSTPLGPALLVLGVAAVLLGRAVQRRLRVTEAIA